MRTDKKFFRFRFEDGQMSEVLALGALPLLLFSGTAVSGLVCGLGMFAVLLLTALLSSLLRRFLSGGGRVFVFAVLSAAFSVTLGLFLKNRLNIGLSGTVRMVCPCGNSSSNCRMAGSKFRLLFGNPQPQIIRYRRCE